MRSVLLSILFIICCYFNTFAQPLNEFYGCHNVKLKGALKHPTPEQLLEIEAGKERSDTFDILHYTIYIDATDYVGKTLKGRCKILFKSKLNNIPNIRFDLTKLVLDSVYRENDGSKAYIYTDPVVNVDLNKTLNIGDVDSLTFIYHGKPHQDPVWGGVYFASNYIYNLGIGISSNPPNFGRVWYPCFDNFVETATYDISVLANGGRKAYSIGTFINETKLGGDSIVRSYRMNQQVPTYLTNFAASNYAEVNFVHNSAFGPVPIQLLAKPGDTTEMKQSFSNIGADVDAMEWWFGKYAWERVGYVLTTVGAMEHPTNIAYPDNVITNGTKANEGLMAHEFGHQWWGNITTLKEPLDMWIKEGNAEYCSHLFTEYVYGKTKFTDVVKTNHLRVLRSAHLDDGKYEPLSGVSFENIYGTTTYYKGASTMHNLRGYMGDSLYKVGMRSILTTFPYKAIDAAQFRDQLEKSTGLDMHPFFEDQIYQPGFAGFEIDSIKYTISGNKKIARVHVQQKLRAAIHFYTKVPLEVSFYNQAGTLIKGKIICDGESGFGDIELPLNYEPVYTLINEDNVLNYARMHTEARYKLKAPYTLPYVEFPIKINQLKDTVFLSVEHMWVAPDPIKNNPYNAKISSTHYWRVGGIKPSLFAANATLEYKSIAANAYLDADLLSVTEDSLILVYRKDPQDDWHEFPYYTKQKLSPTDQQGYIILDSLYFGEYAFANGNLPTVATKEPVLELQEISISPNPSKDIVTITSDFKPGAVKIQIYSIDGKLEQVTNTYINSSQKEVSINVNTLNEGMHVINLISGNKIFGSSKMVKE